MTTHLPGKLTYAIRSLLLTNNCRHILTLLCLVLSQTVYGQLAIEWQRCISPGYVVRAHSMKQTPDGGFIIGGEAFNSMPDWVFAKTDSLGDALWTTSYGGSSYDYLYDVVACADGGYLGVGTTYSNDGDVIGFHIGGSQEPDGWIVKLDANGNLLWQRPVGGSHGEQLFSAIQNQNGEYIVCGYTSSSDGDLTVINPSGGMSTWVLKLDAAGNIIDQSLFGGVSNDVGFKITQATDGGYALACCAMGGGGVLDTSFGDWDAYIAKIDTALDLQWAHAYGGSNQEQMYDIKQTSDGGFIMCGETESNDGYVSGHKFYMDFWVVKTDSLGHFEWQKCLGSSYYEDAHTIVQTPEGNYILTGRMFGGAVDGDITNPIGNGSDFWIACIDTTGNLLWEKSIGGGGYEEAYALTETIDGRYAVAGWTTSNDRDVSGLIGAGNPQNIWLVKFSEHPNTIAGNVFADANANTVQDSGEFSLTVHKITESVAGHKAFSNPIGFYRMDLPDAGTYTVNADSVKYYTCIPASHTATFTGTDEIDSLNDFAFQPSGTVNDLKVTLTSVTPVRPGFPVTFHISYKNVGTVALSGDVSFTFQNFMTYTTSTIAPASITSDSIVWNYTNLLPCEERVIDVELLVSTSVFATMPVQNTVSLFPFLGDAFVDDNRDTLNQYVVNSFDPNDIQVDIDTIYGSQFASPPYLEYTIRFQNTGTFPATFVRVTNPISNLLDMSTFEMIASSHTVSANFLAHSRNMEFLFDNINLPDSTTNEAASHGFIRYRIKPYSSLSANDIISNNAYIYFDYNVPVNTNTTHTYLTPDVLYASITAAVCDSMISPSGNYVWITSGTYSDIIHVSAILDSVYIVNLTVNQPTFAAITAAACYLYISPGGKTWMVSGIYQDTIANAAGCDSIITVNLTINNDSYFATTIIACDKYTSPSGNYTYTLSGIYQDTIANATGCDSIITINLTINTVDTSVIANAPYLTANATGAIYQWMYCDSSLIPGATNQSFTATTNGSYAVIVFQNGCEDTSSCYYVLNVGIDEVKNQSGMKVYPNPAKDRITISGNALKKGTVIKIADVMGKEVYNSMVTSQKSEVNTRDFSNGIYFVQIQTPDYIETRKLIIAR